MAPKIEVTNTVYKRLEALVLGFDTPSSVIERLLDFHDERAKSPSAKRSKGQRLYSNSEIQEKITAIASKFSDSELIKHCDKEFSRAQLGISFPLFVRVPANASQEEKKRAVRSADGVPRWSWKFEFQSNGYSYAVCTQWYPSHDRKVQEWLKVNS
jgi:hypothetical protein